MTINWATKEIFIPQSDQSFVSGTFYTYDTNAGRIAMNVLNASEDGMVFPDINSHNTEVTIVGAVYAKTIEIINGYNITFENIASSVQLEGSNNNMWDIGGGILNQNLVQVIPTNAAGLIVGAGAVTEQDKLDIADRVWDEVLADHIAAGSTGESLQNILNYLGLNATSIEVSGETILTLWTDATLTTPWKVLNLGTSILPKRLDVP